MERDYIVTKSNKLIYANYDLSLNQQKIIITLSSMVQPKDTEFQEYALKIKDFMQLLGITDQSKYKEIPKITKDLMKKVFEIREGNDILQLSWLASVRYKTKEGIVLLKFAPDLKPYLLQLKELYTSYKLSNVLNLKSKYSIRLYEILKSNQYKKQKSFEMKLDELKKMLSADTSAYKFMLTLRIGFLSPLMKNLKKKQIYILIMMR
jgi:plasmid replication initiation protein